MTLFRGLRRSDPSDLPEHPQEVAVTQARSPAPTFSAVAEHPDWRMVRGALGHLLLSTGRWREGWRFYRQSPAKQLSPRLRGEQGIGDVLFFLRFAPALGRKASLACARTFGSNA